MTNTHCAECGTAGEVVDEQLHRRVALCDLVAVQYECPQCGRRWWTHTRAKGEKG